MKVVPSHSPCKRALSVGEVRTSTESCNTSAMTLLFKEESASPVPGRPDESSGKEERAHLERAILCSACSATITSPRHRIAVQNAHEHRFVNPAGFIYHFGCFSEAIGCTIVGPASLEYVWFPGYSWRFALCGSCGQHLGWHFRSNSQDAFFGLILDRLTQPSQDD
jgi:hypothetical protein